MINTRLYEEIKRRIVFLDYSPGQVLIMKDLAEEFGVSVTPIREVLIRLEVEGFVHLTPNRGASVTEVSFQGLRDVFELRWILIGVAGRLATQRATREELAMMNNLLREMERKNSRRSLILLDAEFHDLINRATKNESLVRVLENLRSQVARLWTFIGRNEREGYSRRMVEDFRNLLAAFQSRDTERAERILRDHTAAFIEQVQHALLSPDSILGGKGGEKRAHKYLTTLT